MHQKTQQAATIVRSSRPNYDFKDPFAVISLSQVSREHASSSFVAYSDFENSAAIKAADRTVFIAPTSAGIIPHASGVIATFQNKNYLITATHVLEEAAAGKENELSAYVKFNDQRMILPLKTLTLCYSSFTARDRCLPVGDIAVFEFNHPYDRVSVAQHNEQMEDTFVVGYPGSEVAKWSKTLEPVASFSQSYIKPAPPPPSAYMVELLKRLDEEKATQAQISKNVQKIIYSGAISGGNSGGGIFNQEGELLGICRGPQGTIGKETGLYEFYSISELLALL